MSEETQMEENLTGWISLLRRMRKLALEMQSPEQDGDYVTNEIRKLYAETLALEPDEDGLCDSYRLTFADPNSGKSYLELYIALSVKDGSE